MSRRSTLLQIVRKQPSNGPGFFLECKSYQNKIHSPSNFAEWIDNFYKIERNTAHTLCWLDVGRNYVCNNDNKPI